eukprot:gnl/MRDRNA2_/MRDRNA2_17982_c0_seq1.p1 gnl/MRDRNA2_/MRDRNA2_17982_c0~~gnl/MRDRNA2_/MRDRNA2_17982_c0_seq1.p1  ORF type:complete len:681 (-),score=107.30 gnl/MRDRNA2_/MRDRNA2_17982_c0_seq1:105-2072(-)
MVEPLKIRFENSIKENRFMRSDIDMQQRSRQSNRRLSAPPLQHNSAQASSPTKTPPGKGCSPGQKSQGPQSPSGKLSPNPKSPANTTKNERVARYERFGSSLRQQSGTEKETLQNEPPQSGSHALFRRLSAGGQAASPLKLSPKKVPSQAVLSRPSVPGAESNNKQRLTRCPSAPTARAKVDPDCPDQIFLRFLAEPKAQEILHLFQTLLAKADLHQQGIDSSSCPYHRIRQLALGWRAKELLRVLDKRVQKSHKDVREFVGTDPCPLRAVVVGAGPVGLRVAIELKLSGHDVRVLEKRMDFARINRLHLWDWCKHDLKEFGVKYFDPPGCSFGVDPDYCHIGIGELQSTLYKICLLLGVNITFGLNYLGVERSDNGWNVRVNDTSKMESSLPFDALLGADGANSAVARTPGLDEQFGRVEFGLKKGAAIGLVANFMGNGGPGLRQFSWARQFAEARFAQLERKHAVSLENCVYYRGGLQHYIVMTPTAASLIGRDVFQDPSKEDLTAGQNVRKEKIRDIAQEVAEHFGLPRMPFAPVPDDAMLFDFSGIKRARNGCAFLNSQVTGKPEALVMLVGDGLMQPFWPEGLGIMRGFMSALDTVAAINVWGGHDAEAARTISMDTFAKLKTLCGKTAGKVLQGDISKFAIDPKTRYRC